MILICENMTKERSTTRPKKPQSAPDSPSIVNSEHSHSLWSEKLVDTSAERMRNILSKKKKRNNRSLSIIEERAKRPAISQILFPMNHQLGVSQITQPYLPYDETVPTDPHVQTLLCRSYQSPQSNHTHPVLQQIQPSLSHPVASMITSPEAQPNPIHQMIPRFRQ
jgi:hypothetical protein